MSEPSDRPNLSAPKAVSAVKGEGEHRETKTEDKVKFGEKSALGLGYFSQFFGNIAVNSFAVPVYQMTLALNPVLLGIALSVPRLWDAFTDPVMGYFSDNLHTRWGRRRPLIVIGAVLQGLAFGLIWMVPGGLSESWMVAYLITTLIIYYTCYTIFSVPLTALTLEMTPDYKERTRVMAFCGFFSKIGEAGYQWLFFIASLPFFIAAAKWWGSSEEELFGIRSVGWLVGIVILAGFGMIPGFFVKERYYQNVTSKQNKVKFWVSVQHSLRNRAFVVLISLTALQIVAGMFASSTDYYLIVYHMFDGDIAEGSKWKGILSTGYAVVGMLSLYPVNWLANKYGKRTALAIIFGMVFFGSIGKWVLYTPGNPWKILLDPILCGPIWIAITVLLPSMVADVCDDDELRHGQRREGMFSCVYLWVQKVGYSASILGMGLALQISGFDASLGGNQSEESIFTLRLFLAISTAVWALLAIVVLVFYPLTRQKAYDIRDALEERRGKV